MVGDTILKDLNRHVRQAHCEASDKLHYLVIFDPVLFLLPMLRGQTGKISVLSVDISVLEQRGHCWTEVPLKKLSKLLSDAKGVFDAIHRSESAALSMQDKRSAVEGLALREGIGRTKTLLRWCHSEANVADALTKLDNRGHELLRKFLQSKV